MEKLKKIIDLICLRIFQVILGYVGICILVILMDMSSDIGVPSMKSGVTNRTTNTGFKTTRFKKYEPPKIEWVEAEKRRIEYLNRKPFKENKTD